MQMKQVVTMLLALALLLSVAGCSEEKKEEKSTGTIEKATTETAKAMTERLQKPLDKAKAVQQAMGEERTDAMDKALEKR